MKRERSTGGIQCPIMAYIAGHVSPYLQGKVRISHEKKVKADQSLQKAEDASGKPLKDEETRREKLHLLSAVFIQTSFYFTEFG